MFRTAGFLFCLCFFFSHFGGNFKLQNQVFRSQTSDRLWTYFFGHNTSEIGRFRNSDIERTSERLSKTCKFQTFNFRLRILGVITSDILWTADFGLWTFEQTYIVLQTLDIIQTVFGQTSDIKLRIASDFVVDFRHQFSDFGLWTSDILQTPDFSLPCQTSYRCQTSDSKTQTI